MTSMLALCMITSALRLYISSMRADLKVLGPWTSGRAAATSLAMVMARTLGNAREGASQSEIMLDTERRQVDSPCRGGQKHIALDERALGRIQRRRSEGTKASSSAEAGRQCASHAT